METRNGGHEGALHLLTAQEMLERCIVPVKAEFLIRKVQPTPKEKVHASSLMAADQVAEPSAAAPGDDKPKQNGEQEQIRNKSRKQMRKEVSAGRTAALCTKYALGHCTQGEQCRFSHDLAEYVRSKPTDLPGACPWTAVQTTCPYGITCRYARSHVADDEQHRTLEAMLTAAPSAPDGTERISEKPADAELEVEGGVLQAAAVATAVVVSSGGPCALPPPSSIHHEMNFLSKELQMLLWKNRYDYSRADAILKSMDLRLSFKHPPKTITGGRAGDGKKGGSQAGAVDMEVADKHQKSPSRDEQMVGDQQEQQWQEQVQLVEMKREQMKVEASTTPGPEEGEGQGEAMQADGEATGKCMSSDTAAEETAICATMSPAAKRQRIDLGGRKNDGSSDAVALASMAGEQAGKAAGAPPAPVVEAGPTGRSAQAILENRAAHVEVHVRPCERRRVDFRGKTYLAPLTTVGNLPFRRVCKTLGVDVTCGEMALATNLLQGHLGEWALMKRHPSEDLFGVQVCGGYPDALARVGQILGEQITVDFVDINMGCPIDLVCDKNAGSALLRQPRRIEQLVRVTSAALGEIPLTFKTRKGYNDGQDVAHTFLHKASEWGAAAVTLHGRTRQQRYGKLADWSYIQRCGASCAEAGLQLIGNGDVLSYLDWNQQMEGAENHLATLMIGRGALIKPWIFTEIREQRHWDISAPERLDLYKQFCSTGLEHWGSDARGVETTRRFLLEWLSYTCRYVPVGLLEVVPQRMNHRPPAFRGRNELETLLSSEEPQDWVRISEMLLGPPPEPLNFVAKHKSNSYSALGATSELDLARG